MMPTIVLVRGIIGSYLRGEKSEKPEKPEKPEVVVRQYCRGVYIMSGKWENGKVKQIHEKLIRTCPEGQK
jgi:hypothetical protein